CLLFVLCFFLLFSFLLFIFLCFFFFFSSRRRHTRSLRDWSSDVCSSDLGELLVGSADIQSLADLGNSFELVRSMRVVPVTRDAVLQLAVITLVPIAPLLLTMVSLEELLKRLLQVVF